VTGVGRLACSDVVSLVFTDVSRGLALCDNYPTLAFERTTDGGTRWSRLTSSLLATVK
jgi:photosystem II stability/assembly factor-like uncharacterized protein